MEGHTTLNILLALGLALYLAVVAILVRQYLRTRDVGVVWLGAAVVVWPPISRLLDAGLRVSIARAVNSQPVIYPFNLIASGQMTIRGVITSFALFQQLTGVCLLLVAVLYLSRTRNHTVRPMA
jgi:hypothetical protein